MVLMLIWVGVRRSGGAGTRTRSAWKAYLRNPGRIKETQAYGGLHFISPFRDGPHVDLGWCELLDAGHRLGKLALEWRGACLRNGGCEPCFRTGSGPSIAGRVLVNRSHVRRDSWKQVAQQPSCPEGHTLLRMPLPDHVRHNGCSFKYCGYSSLRGCELRLRSGWS